MAELIPEFWSLLTAKEPAAYPTMKQGITCHRRTDGYCDVDPVVCNIIMLASCRQCTLALSLICLPTSFSFFGPARNLGELPG